MSRVEVITSIFLHIAITIAMNVCAIHVELTLRTRLTPFCRIWNR
jgi:hypothetical protein